MAERSNFKLKYDFQKHISTISLVSFGGLIAVGYIDSPPLAHIRFVALYLLLISAILSLVNLNNIVRYRATKSIPVLKWKGKVVFVLSESMAFIFLVSALILMALAYSRVGDFIHYVWSLT